MSTARFSVTGGVMAAILTGIFSVSSAAGQTLGMLSENDVTTSNLRVLFNTAFLRCEVDRDGDLVIQDEGAVTYASVHEDRKYIRFFSLCKLRPEFSDAQKLNLVNTMNKEVMLVRFFAHDATRLVCDYWFSFDNGVSAYQIMSSYRWYRRVVTGAIQQYDPLNIIGTGGRTSGSRDRRETESPRVVSLDSLWGARESAARGRSPAGLVDPEAGTRF
jgi:hypothetical protein